MHGLCAVHLHESFKFLATACRHVSPWTACRARQLTLSGEVLAQRLRHHAEVSITGLCHLCMTVPVLPPGPCSEWAA